MIKKIVYLLVILLYSYNTLHSQENKDSLKYYLQGVVVRSKTEDFKRSADAPLSKMTISSAQIETSAGGNRDISKIITSLPGVATPPPNGYRNDFLVRGGGPAENKFYIDGIEVPSINHFSTQGAGGGPVSILNADFIRKVDFYTGSFPVARSNALSSVMDITLRDGSPVKNSLKLVVGASEVGLSADGNLAIKDKDGFKDPKLFYALSIRRSYLQFLFKALSLPFLPTFTDAQLKLRYRINANNELSFLFLGGVDRMKLNVDGVEDESAEYIIGYLPVIKQDVFTTGLTYKHYYNGNKTRNNTLAIYLSYSYLKNRSIKYTNNQDWDPNSLILNYNSIESGIQLRGENMLRFNNLTFIQGIGISLPHYTNNTFQKRFINNQEINLNSNSLMNLFNWNAFANLQWWTKDKKLSLSGSIRLDGSNYNSNTINPLNQLSPRFSLSYEFSPGWKLNFGAGRYFQLPAYTIMGYNNMENKGSLKYLSTKSLAVGLEYNPNPNLQVQLEPFVKWYNNSLYSPQDSIPLTQGGTDYGNYGNERAASGLKTRAFGVELAVRWNIGDKFNFIGSYTFYKSEYKWDEFLFPTNGKRYGKMPWDNGNLLSLTTGYEFAKNFRVGAKFRLSGGAPYTPYNWDKTSLVNAWDIKGQPYYDYNLYNTEKLPIFHQLDIRVDKSFYFNKWALELYLDLQNILNTKYKYPDIIMSTGEIENPLDPKDQQRYKLKSITNESGTILPTIGIIISI